MSATAVDTRLAPRGVENRIAVVVAFAVIATASIAALVGLGASYAFMIAVFGLAVVVSVASFEWAMATFFFVALAQNWYPLYIKAGGFNVRLSQFLTFVLLQTLIVEHFRGRIRLKRVPFVWFFAALFGAMLVSTILFSPLLKRGLGTTFLLGVNIAHYVLAFWLVTIRAGLYPRTIRLLAIITVVLVVAGLANVFFLVVDVPVISPAFKSIAIQQDLFSFSYTDTRTVIWRPRGWGTSTGCYMVSLGFSGLGAVFDTQATRRSIYRVAAIASVVGVVISLTRGPILTGAIAFVTLVAVFAAAGRFRQLGRVLMSSVVGLALLVPILYTLRQVPYIQGFFARLGQVGNVQQGSALPRLYSWARMIADIRDHPITGVGADTYRIYMAEFHRDTTFKYPSENFPLEILHSTGLLGFVPYLVAHVGIVAVAVRTLARTKPFNSTIAGVVAGFVGLWLGGSTTNIAATGTAYWVLLALVSAAPYAQPAQPAADDGSGVLQGGGRDRSA